eukprot:TRINITY_DN10245_c0_g1_i1.p1 TRINITY_DN10245_c0_g1~~TRINITY_DN10245_c0_g1_i1.p1  ORF type:complete len:165 (+),score=30.22 TRINITY_DN10245_c0_g1_i1:194-688(+)
MGFIVGLLLIVTEDEEVCFWLFLEIMKSHRVMGMYENGSPVLNRCLTHFKKMAYLFFPDLSAYIENQSVALELFANKWLRTLFAYDFPLEFTLKVWDMFWFEGLDFIMIVGLAMLHHFEEKIMTLKGVKAMQFMLNIAEHISAKKDFDEVFEYALDILRAKEEI